MKIAIWTLTRIAPGAIIAPTPEVFLTEAAAQAARSAKNTGAALQTLVKHEIELPIFPMPDEREIATILAALRCWQMEIEAAHEDGEPFGYGVHFEDVSPLTLDEINALCERLNTEHGA